MNQTKAFVFASKLSVKEKTPVKEFDWGKK